jgi:hypothetical protein
MPKASAAAVIAAVSIFVIALSPESGFGDCISCPSKGSAKFSSANGDFS